MKTQENSSLMSLQEKAFVETKVARLLGHTKPPFDGNTIVLEDADADVVAGDW
jgi:hypothetical protein